MTAAMTNHYALVASMHAKANVILDTSRNWRGPMPNGTDKERIQVTRSNRHIKQCLCGGRCRVIVARRRTSVVRLSPPRRSCM
jgi:hypothetical protein